MRRIIEILTSVSLYYITAIQTKSNKSIFEIWHLCCHNFINCVFHRIDDTYYRLKKPKLCKCCLYFTFFR